MFNYAKLEACIKQSGKTKTYLCKQLGRPPYYLRDVLRQKNIIPEEYQAILADELGVTVAFLNDAETESNSHKAQKNIPTPEGEDDFVLLDFAAQEQLYAMFSAAIKAHDITDGLAVVRANVDPQLLMRMKDGRLSMANRAELYRLSRFLELQADAESYISNLPGLDDRRAELYRQLHRQILHIDPSQIETVSSMLQALTGSDS